VRNQRTAEVLRELSPARVFARPTAENLWLGPAQESALSQLSGPGRIRALLGPLASGRSTLLRRLAAGDAKLATLALTGPQRFKSAVLRALLQSAGLETDGLDATQMRRILDLWLRERLHHGQRVAVLVDDADGFGPAAFSELERLLSVETPDRRRPELLLTVVHIDAGSSPAADFLRAQTAPELCVVSWMSERDVVWYLHWRLHRYGLDGVISPAAVRLIAQCTKGCFAAVDHVCQIALLLLRQRGGDCVDVLLVREALLTLRRRRSLAESSDAEPPRGQLLVSHDGEIVGSVDLGDRLLIGRSELNDLCLENEYLSRHHALIVRFGAGFAICDLNSANGVVLNGQEVQSSPISDGDVIRLGDFRIKVKLDRAQGGSGAGNDDPLADTGIMPPAGPPGPSHLRVVR